MCRTCVTHVSHMFLSSIRNECSVVGTYETIQNYGTIRHREMPGQVRVSLEQSSVGKGGRSP